MATYTIVSSSKSPLQPGEIAAGTTITVSDGDVFIIDPGADNNITFASDGGVPANFTIQIDDSNTHTFGISVGSDLSPDITVADNVDMSQVDISAQHAGPVNLTAGNGVTMGKLDTSRFDDTVSLGDDFTAVGDWNLLEGDDFFTAGENADFTASKLKSGDGNDTIEFGDGAQFDVVDAGEDDDTLIFGDNISGAKILGGSGAGNDSFWIGSQANITDVVDGENGDDTLTTQTGGLPANKMESTDVICFAEGTRIATSGGWMPVEALRPGVRVHTLDHGPVPLLWRGLVVADAPTLRRNRRLRPIRIAADALGPGIPRRDLVVSPQHRILVASAITSRLFGVSEILAPANKLLPLEGVTREPARDGVRYHHLLFARHEIVLAENAAAESLLVTPRSLAACSPDMRQQILHVVQDIPAPVTPARRIVERNAELRDLLRRHRKNAKPLQTGLAGLDASPRTPGRAHRHASSPVICGSAVLAPQSGNASDGMIRKNCPPDQTPNQLSRWVPSSTSR